MHYPLLPFYGDAEWTKEQLEAVWKIDDLLGSKDKMKQTLDVATIENDDYRITIRMMNRYGGGVPTFYKGYLQIFGNVSGLSLEDDNPSLLIHSYEPNRWCWEKKDTIDFSQGPHFQSVWYGPRQIVQDAQRFSEILKK